MKSKIFFFLILSIIIISFFYNSDKKKELKKNLVYTECRVIDFVYYGKTNYYLKYIFFVDGFKFTGEVITSYFKCSDESEGCIGKKFRVGYSKINPKNNEIDLEVYNKYKKSVNSILK